MRVGYGLGDVTTGATDVVSQLLSAYQQKQLIDINAQRLAQGQPPIDSSALAAQVSVAADPEQLAQAKQAFVIGIGVLVLVLVLTRGKR